MINSARALKMLQMIEEKPVTTSFSISLALYVLLKAYAKSKQVALSDFAVKSLSEQLLKDLDSCEGIPEQLVADAVANSAQVGDKKRVMERFGLQDFVPLDKEERRVPNHSRKVPSDLYKQALSQNTPEVSDEDYYMDSPGGSYGKTTRKELIRQVKQLNSDNAQIREQLSSIERFLREMKKEGTQ